MSNVQHDVAALSSGTMAVLTGLSRYDQLQAEQSKFWQWVFSLESCGTYDFTNWMQAWEMYNNGNNQ